MATSLSGLTEPWIESRLSRPRPSICFPVCLRARAMLPATTRSREQGPTSRALTAQQGQRPIASQRGPFAAKQAGQGQGHGRQLRESGRRRLSTTSFKPIQDRSAAEDNIERDSVLHRHEHEMRTHAVHSHLATRNPPEGSREHRNGARHARVDFRSWEVLGRPPPEFQDKFARSMVRTLSCQAWG